MNIKYIKNIILPIFCFLFVGIASSFAPTNFFPPYDPALKLSSMDGGREKFRLGVNVEYGDTSRCRNIDERKANILQIYDDTQSTIAMLVNAQNTQATTLLQNLMSSLSGNPLDDGVRGHVSFAGDFWQVDVTPHARYLLPFDFIQGYLGINVMLPVRFAEVSGVKFQDQTRSVLCIDQDVNDQLSGAAVFTSTVKALGGPDFGAWNKTGLGDLVIMFDWHNDYPQDKDDLKNVTLSAKLGLSCPTGEEKDEDKAFSLAFGHNGAWALPFGLGIDLDFTYHIRLGAEAEFNVIFDHSKVRRLKTFDRQTEFLLLNKGRATLDHGLMWKFYLYLQAFRLARCVSLKAAYEYVKQDDGRLTPKTDNFSASVINTAKSLREWNMHHLIFSFNYDADMQSTWSVKPQLSLFYKLPLTGRGIIQPHTFGGQLAINF